MSSKVSRPGSQAGSQNSKMSDARRERLVEIQKREQLKGMLVHKFKLKYGNKSGLNNFITNEVNRFLNNDRLTEGNLKALDGKIGKEAMKKDKQEAILYDRKSQRSQSAYSNAAKSQKSQGGLSKQSLNRLNQENDAKSRSSRMSNGAVSQGKAALSVASSRAPPTEVFSEINENQEWTAIQKFNTLLHYEEQKQSLMRDAERKRLIREELDKQIQAKKTRADEEKNEATLYDQMQEEHGKLLEQREIDKANAVREKIMNDKNQRDLQLKQEKQRKRRDDKEQLSQEINYINRLRSELEAERAMQLEKRKQEKEYLQKMLLENEENKRRQKLADEEQRLQDLRSQEEYAKMLEKQEADRLREMKNREARAQEFMNKMADNVLAKMDKKQQLEDMMLARYENEKEMRQRQLEERRAQKQKEEQQKMRDFLAQQIKDKNQREKEDRDNINQQAKMWELDKQNWDDEERRLKNRINDINRSNQEYLINQMKDKAAISHAASGKMDGSEFALNRPLLRQVNEKLKGLSNYGEGQSVQGSEV